MNVSDRIKRAHIAIMNHKKFCAFSGILACGKVLIVDSVPTAATNGWDVRYNPKFIEEHMATDPELRFLVLHEATHKAYRHLSVWRALSKENALLANIAMDHFVNLSLQDTDNNDGFIRMPKVGIMPDPKYRGWSVQMIYNDLKSSGQTGDGDGGVDEHDWDGAVDDKTEQVQAEEIQRAIRQGEMLRRKLAGKESGSGDGVFDSLLAPKIDWKRALREFVTETCSARDESSWRRPNRRFLGMGMYMPSMEGTTMNELVVGFDTSGSVFNSPEMDRFASELRTIVEDVKPNKVHVIYWGSSVVGHQTFEDGQFTVQMLKPTGGGGTDGAVLFDYLRSNRINPQAIVQLTDGYVGDWGRSDWPTLWGVTSHLRAPFGTTIQIEV